MTTHKTTAHFDGATHRYSDFLHSIQKTFKEAAKERLFVTDASGLWDLFLQHLPEEARQTYNCSTCRHFVNQFGGLVRIKPDGTTRSALWNTQDVPAFFQPSVSTMQQAVKQARVTGLFVSALPVYGKPHTDHWRHMAVTAPAKIIWQSPILYAGQYMAQKREEFHMLERALAEFSAETTNTAVKLLSSDKLYRSEKVLGVAQWLKDVQADVAGIPNLIIKSHKLWLAVANAPDGFCHVRSSVIGTLLEDIELGFEFSEIRQRFDGKMHPLQYQRPQAPPHAGNIKQAEKIIAALQAEKALERRYARWDELKLVWQPKALKVTKQAPEPAVASVFAHLIPSTKTPVQDLKLPSQTMTWEKFERKVLPDALKIELWVLKKTRLNLCALTTAVNAKAPPILQWDHVEQRNPFSVYVYHGGSLPSDWHLAAGYVEVTGLCTNPPHWHKDLSHQHKGMILILKGARDRCHQTAGAAIFPENLKSEFHSIRKTIEAFSRSAHLQGFEESSACGLFITSNGSLNHQLRVTSELGVQDYLIDRWD